MRKMRKILCLFLVVALFAIGMVACTKDGGGEKKTDEGTATKEATIETTVESESITESNPGTTEDDKPEETEPITEDTREFGDIHIRPLG